MNATIKGIVEAIALRVEGKDNPVRMCQLAFAVPVKSEHDAVLVAGARIAEMAFGPAVQGNEHVLAYKSIKPCLVFGAHDLDLTEELKFRVQPTVHEIRAGDTVDIVYRMTFPLTGNESALIYLAENLGDQITVTLSAAQQELPLDNLTTIRKHLPHLSVAHV